MNSYDPPEVIELFTKIAALRPQAVEFTGVMLRSVGTRYASEADFFSGGGAAAHGGRWSRRGILAVYASLDVITATREAYQNFVEGGFPLSAIRPRVMAGARIRLQAVLDLRQRRLRRKLGFGLNELLEEDWKSIQNGGEESWTQAIGRGCRDAGFEGLLVNSARQRRGTNLVAFPDRFARGSKVVVLAAAELPPHPANLAD